MAPLDWTRLMALDVLSLEDDEDATEDMYAALSEYELGEEADPGRLKKLFEVTRALMMSKGLAADMTMEHMTQLKADEGKSLTKKAQEIEELKLDVQALKKKNKELERSGGDGSMIGGVEVRHLRDTNYELESQIVQLHKDVQEKDVQLLKEKKSLDEVLSQQEESTRKLRELKADNDQLRDEVHDMKRQLEAQRDTMLARRDGDVDVKDKIAQKNLFLNAALDENRNLTEQNVRLEDELSRLRREMKEGEREIEKTTDEFLKIQTRMDLNEREMDVLSKENKMLKGQLEDMMEQVKSKSDADDEIMSQVEAKVQEWKLLLADKDERILEQQRQLVKAREDLVAANMDTDKTSVVVLTKALDDKDRQIEALTQRLTESVADLHDNAALIDDVRSRVIHSGGGQSDLTRRKITSMQSTIRQHEDQLVDMEKRTVSAEADAREKDKELNELMEKMMLYEQGVYGLPEAVTEIKQAKVQVRERDRNIEELTQYINRCEVKMNELYDEAEELRERLGLDPKEPINLTEIRQKKTIRLQQDRALNRVLQKEIEKLEEERIELKQQMRKLAQSTGQKAVAMGLTADQVAAVDAFIDQIKTSNDLNPPKSFLQTLKADQRADDKRIRDRVSTEDSDKSTRRINTLYEECTELRSKNDELEQENKLLEQGLREIREQLLKGGAGKGGGEPIASASLDKILLAMESRSVLGRYDKSVILKAQVDNLTGRNEELRRELKESHVDQLKAQDLLSRAVSKRDGLETELKTLRGTGGAGALYQTMPLPDGMVVSNAELIANLNEHLVVALQELSVREDVVARMEEGLESYKRKFAIIRHQQGLLYREHMDDKKKWEESTEKLTKELSECQGARTEDQVKIQEFDRLLDTLAQDEPEVRRRLADSTRKMTVLRVNEQALTRRYTALNDMLAALRKENGKLKTDMISQQKAIAERLGYLQRHKDMVSFKVAGLQKALDDSVPASQLEVANKQYTELTEKYRVLLESSKSLVAHKEESSGYQMEVKRLNDESNALRRELEIDKEKLHTLEATFENIRAQGLTKSSDALGVVSGSADLLSLARRLTTIEMKELNERQRADHAARMYEQQKNALRALEDRNFELEHKFAELTRINLELQKVERELRDELSNSVLKAVSDMDRKKIFDLEQIQAALSNEVLKLKEVSDVATMQVHEIQNQQQSHDKELTSLRQQLLDIQCQSDEKTVIGKLHRHIIQLQVSEGTALRRAEEAGKRLARLEAHSLRLEQRTDERDQTIYHNRLEARNKQNHLRQTIQDLRRKYTGAVPLADQEKFAHLMIKLQENQKSVEEEMKKTTLERQRVEDRLAELSLAHKGLEELMATLKDGRGAAKVAEWHAKMEAVRLEDLRYKRSIERLQQQMKFQESLLKKHESEVLSVEEDKVRMRKDFELSELEWEQREVELERRIANLEKQQAEIAGAASQFEDAVGSLPDTSLPLIDQLEHAITTIKRNVKLILDAKAQAAVNHKRNEELEKEMRDKDRELLTRDRLITDLRLRLPATAERDAAFARSQKQSQSALGGAPPGTEDYEGSQAVRVAHSTIESLQARLAQKEETIAQYQLLLQQSHDDLSATIARHEEETRRLQQQLHANNQAAFKKFKASINESMSQPGKAVPSTAQLKRLNELEDQLAERDNSAAALRDKLRAAQSEVEEWKLRHQLALKHAVADTDNARREGAEEVRRVAEAKDAVERQLAEARREVDATQEEVTAQREANTRAPTAAMKRLVERLTNQLALKENQLKTMSQALLDLRGDMVQLAESGVKAKGDLDATELNVKKLVDRRTKELTDLVEEQGALIKKQKGEVKKQRDREKELESSLQASNDNLAKKEAQLKKAREDKDGLVAENAELQQKVQRMGSMRKQRGETEGFHHELDELRRKNRLLSEELDRHKLQAEKPYEQQGASPGRERQEKGVASWTDKKKWEKKVELLKTRAREKDGEIEKLTRANDLLKNALDRVSKDKDMLDARFRAASAAQQHQQQGGAAVKAVHAAVLGAAAPGGTGGAHVVQDLHNQNHELQDEVASLRRQLMMGRDAAFEEVMLQNKFLTDKLQKLEADLSRRHSATSQRPQAERGVEYRDLALKEDQLQKQVLKLSQENLELRFEVEQANKDIPRLKGRVEDLQKYVEVLKAEKAQLELMGRGGRESLSGLSSTSSNVRRIGESGRSPQELEKTISLLKKVVERTQQENERLKRPGLAAPEGAAGLQAENQALRNQLDELRSKVGSTLSERTGSKDKGTAKIIHDYEKVRKDLVKEMDGNEKLRVRLSEVEQLLEQRERELDQKHGELETERSRKTSLGAMDAKGYKSVVHARISEERIHSLEEELEKKNKLLSDAKLLLRESSSREQQAAQERHELEKKVAVLENFPPGTKVTDADLMRDYQSARLTIDRLENEKRELMGELQSLRRLSNPSAGGPNDVSEDMILSKLRSHDRLVEENVDLNTKLKLMQLDKTRLQQELDKSKKELVNFGPDFFEEIEDLKFNYNESLKKIAVYEEQLRKVTKQFGVSLGVPGI